MRPVTRSVGALEAKTHLAALLDAVAAGEQITITRHGRPVARLVPPDDQARPEDTGRFAAPQYNVMTFGLHPE